MITVGFLKITMTKVLLFAGCLVLQQPVHWANHGSHNNTNTSGTSSLKLIHLFLSMSQTPKFWLSVPSWVNNSHSNFWLSICPWSQKMGDSSAVVVAFHLCRSYCINAWWSPRENINARFSLNISQLWGGRQLNLCYLDHYGWAQHIWALNVTIQTC